MAGRCRQTTFTCCMLVCLSGCFLPDTATTTSRRSFAQAPALPSDVVQIDVALVQRPLGDPFLDKELWESTIGFVGDLARQAAVEDNGFRVGHVVGLTPERLVDLLRSERSCLNPRRRLVPPGKSTDSHLGPILASTTVQVSEGGSMREHTFAHAQFGLTITPTLRPDGRIQLAFVPRIEHGTVTFPIKVAPDYSGWLSKVEKPCQSFPQLAFDATLAPGEFLVIGGARGRPGSLGHRAFTQSNDADPCQRVLVLRPAYRGDPKARVPNLEEVARSPLAPTLALQASVSAIRAQHSE